MKRRLLACIMLTVCLLNLLCGCNNVKKKRIDYDTDTQAKQAAMTSNKNEKSNTSQFGNAESMKFEYKTKDGISITVDSEVEAPYELNDEKVVEAERIVYTPDKKEKILKAFYHDSQVHVYDTASHIATDKITTDYAENAFWGCRDGIEYVVDFVNPEYRSQDDQVEKDYFKNHAYVIYPVNQKDVVPEALSKYDEVKAETDYEVDEDIKNKCKYTSEQAQKMAEDILSDLDLKNYTSDLYEVIKWTAGRIGDNNLIQDDCQQINGYIFDCYLPIDKDDKYSMAVDASGFLLNTFIDTTQNDGLYQLDGGPMLNIAISDKGLVYMAVSMLFEIKNITTPEKLLPLSTIEGIIEDELKSYNREFVKKYDSSEPSVLVYNNGLRMTTVKQQKKNSELIYYIPVWELSRRSMGLTIRVNAIDGSVLEYSSY